MRILWIATEEKEKIWIQLWLQERKEYARHAEIVFWGPGFPDYDAGLSAPSIIRGLYDEDPPDWIVIGPHYLVEIPKGLDQVDIPKAMLMEDTYEQLLSIVTPVWKENDVSVIFHRYIEDIEKFKTRHLARFHWLPWAVDPEDYPNQEHRPFDVSLMGRLNYRYYDVRRAVWAALESSGLKVVRKEHPGCFRPDRGAPRPNTVWGRAYGELLGKAKIGISTGGVPLYPVAKYFEIPATGSLLLAQKVPALDRLGFVDGENMVVLDTDEPVDQIRELLQNPDRLSRIALAGRQLILDRHTWSHRARTFLHVLKECARDSRNCNEHRQVPLPIEETGAGATTD